jgi:uncharacterized protein (DUF3820 family)
MTEKNDNIVPFGKYKGRLVEELLVDDPDYVEWLSSQDWFRAKFVSLHQVIINRGAEPEETPDHNALQVLFLDDGFCLKFMRVFDPRFRADNVAEDLAQLDRKIAAEIKLEQERREEVELRNEEHKNPPDGKWSLSAWERKCAAEKKLQESTDRIKSLKYDLAWTGHRFQFDRRFEVKGVDVILEVKKPYWVHLMIEIKPVVSDNYPAVLRQMRGTWDRDYRQVLFLERYTGIGATREQFIQTFKSAGIRVIFRDEVECTSTS